VPEQETNGLQAPAPLLPDMAPPPSE